jgi:hypothetical protein
MTETEKKLLSLNTYKNQEFPVYTINKRLAHALQELLYCNKEYDLIHDKEYIDLIKNFYRIITGMYEKRYQTIKEQNNLVKYVQHQLIHPESNSVEWTEKDIISIYNNFVESRESLLVICNDIIYKIKDILKLIKQFSNTTNIHLMSLIQQLDSAINLAQVEIIQHMSTVKHILNSNVKE